MLYMRERARESERERKREKTEGYGMKAETCMPKMNDKSRGKKRRTKNSAYLVGTHDPYTTHRVSPSPDLCDKKKN